MYELDNLIHIRYSIESTLIEKELQNEISTARSLSVISYPSLLLEHGSRLFPVSVDYLDHETMIREIASILEKTPVVSC